MKKRVMVRTVAMLVAGMFGSVAQASPERVAKVAGETFSVGKLSQKLSAEAPAALADDARKRGDAARGAVLFYQPLMACTKCHISGQLESPLGPDLSAVGREASDVHLIESVLHPSKVIKKGYKSVTVVTKRGQTLIGILVDDTPNGTVIRDAAQNWKEIRLVRDEIDEVRPSALSIMPTGQVDVLKSRQQFLDIVRYLIEIRDGGAKRARELEPAPELYADRALAELKNAVDGKPLGEPELKMARELFTSRGCVACHQYPHQKAPSLTAVSEKYAPNKEGLQLLKASLASGSASKWGKLLMPPQAHLQAAERHLLARWVLGLHQSGEKPPGSAARVEGFATPQGFDVREWTHYQYYGSRSVAVAWNKSTQDLSLRKNNAADVAGFYRTGYGRAPGDVVTLTVKKVHADGTPWAQVGLMISSVPQPKLLASQSRYEWMVRRETNGAGWVYRVRKDVGSGGYELYSSKLVDPNAAVRLDISRKGDQYEFRANGVLHYTTGDNANDTYSLKTRDSMIYFGLTFGGGGAMSATIDDLSVGFPVTGAKPGSKPTSPAETVGNYSFVEKRNGALIQVLDKPVVYRTYLPDAPSRAIAVGLPGGVSFGFDAQNCKLLYAWRGGFMDVSRSWIGMGGWYSKLLGQKFHTAPASFPLRIGDPEKKPSVQFKGYDLVDGYPVFKYMVDGALVRHQIVISEVDKSVPSVQHLFHIAGNKKPVYFVAGEKAGASHASEDADWKDGRWTVRADKLAEFSIGVAR